MDVLISNQEVKLCSGEQGLVISVPVRQQGKFVGIVAGMLPVKGLRRELDRGLSNCIVSLVNDRGQTDPGVADGSEADQVGYALEFALRDVVVDHLMGEQAATLATSLKDQEWSLRRQAGCRNLPGVFCAETMKVVGRAQEGARWVKWGRAGHRGVGSSVKTGSEGFSGSGCRCSPAPAARHRQC